MSKFVTTIPTDIAEVVEKLPPGSYIHSITLNADRTIAIVWDHDKHKTPYTFPLECPVEKLDEISESKKVKPTINQLQEILDNGEDTPIEVLSNGEIRAKPYEVNNKVKVDKRTKEYKESLRNAKNPA